MHVGKVGQATKNKSIDCSLLLLSLSLSLSQLELDRKTQTRREIHTEERRIARGNHAGRAGETRSFHWRIYHVVESRNGGIGNREDSKGRARRTIGEQSVNDSVANSELHRQLRIRDLTRERERERERGAWPHRWRSLPALNSRSDR